MKKLFTVLLACMLLCSCEIKVKNPYFKTPADEPIETTESSPTPTEDFFDYTNDYTMSYINENKDYVTSLLKDDSITYITVTDIHVDKMTDDRFNQLRDIVLLTRSYDIDYVAVLGDLISNTYAHDEAMELMEKVHEILEECNCPVYYTRGDHDYNMEDETHGGGDEEKDIITAADWDSIFKIENNRKLNVDSNNPDGAYYYVDFSDLKHRAIFVNSYEFIANSDGTPHFDDDGTPAYWLSKVKSKEQIKWLTEDALNMDGKSTWTVSFFSHSIPYNDNLDTADRTFHGYGNDNTPLRQILQAFTNGTVFSGEYNSSVGDITADFSRQGKMETVGWFSGHIHDDCFERVDDLNMYVSTCTCAHTRSSWSHDEFPTHLPPERNETDKAMSVNMFILSPSERKVNVVKFGSKSNQGMTEEFLY